MQRKFHADDEAFGRAVLGEDVTPMLLNNSLAGAQAESRERTGGKDRVTAGSRLAGKFITDRAGIDDVDDGNSRLMGAGDSQSSSRLTFDCVHGAVEKLHADLKQLIGIANHGRHFGLEMSFHLNVEALPLRL